MNKWDEKFSGAEYAYGQKPNIFLVEQFMRYFPAGAQTVLSLGEGEGRNAVYLAGFGEDVYIADSSFVGLEKAERLAKK
ncbi:hypothetical protein RE070_004458 [Klebsiella aerogenes]|nr:hypothetical protein [Klebsiella aerogenes]HEO1674954.1 hypothetical protein [Klebsiella aerogenes]